MLQGIIIFAIYYRKIHTLSNAAAAVTPMSKETHIPSASSTAAVIADDGKVNINVTKETVLPSWNASIPTTILPGTTYVVSIERGKTTVADSRRVLSTLRANRKLRMQHHAMY